MRLLDSSVWIEHLTGGDRIRGRRRLFARPAEIIVSTINLFEIGRYIERSNGQEALAEVIAHLSRCRLVGVDEAVALRALPLARKHQLHATDALIAATAERTSAELWTFDADLLRYPGARQP